MKQTPIQLFVEEAPVDPFNTAGPQLYQVVAVHKASGDVWQMTDRHPTAQAAMAQMRRSVRGALTRYEHDMFSREVDRRFATVESRIRRVFDWANIAAASWGSRRRPDPLGHLYFDSIADSLAEAPKEETLGSLSDAKFTATIKNISVVELPDRTADE